MILQDEALHRSISPERSRKVGAWRKGKGSSRQSAKTQGPRVYARSLASKRTEGMDEEAANQREDWVGANQEARSTCVHPFSYVWWNKEGSSSLRSFAGSQPKRSCYRAPPYQRLPVFGQSLPNPPQKSTKRNHTLWIDVVTRHWRVTRWKGLSVWEGPPLPITIPRFQWDRRHGGRWGESTWEFSFPSSGVCLIDWVWDSFAKGPCSRETRTIYFGKGIRRN